MRRVAALGLAFSLFISIPSHAEPVDITKLVKKETDLDERIIVACSVFCQGNRRKGSLEKVTIERKSRWEHLVKAWARLINHHDLNTHLGVKLPSFQYTMEVQAEGILNEDNCILTIRHIKILRDKLGLNKLVKGEEGKSYPIKNCKRFIK